MSEVTKDVNVSRLVQPKFLTLVGRPANQVAFKVIRNDEGEATMTVPHIKRSRATRSDALLSIAFSLDADDDSIKTTMDGWGISGYTVEVEAERKVVRCSDAPDGAETLTIGIGNGATATILKPISQRSDGGKEAIAVSSISFALDYFPTIDDISEWCSSNGIDISGNAMENGGQNTVVRRDVKVEAGEETRQIEVDSGVQFTVIRADVQDIPENFTIVVNDTMYGSYGWGQLDFAARMADKEFSEVADEAIYTLRSVLNEIIFYSTMPASVKKTLVANATTQFSNYLGTLLDALPARVVIANRSEEKPMSTAAQTTQTTETPAGTTATATPAPAPAAEGVSRADFDKLVTSVNALTDTVTALSKRSEAPAPAPTGTTETPAGSTEAPAESEITRVLRSVETLAQAVGTLNERVAGVEGTTVARSDGGDTTQTAQRTDVFKGMFGKSGKASA